MSKYFCLKYFSLGQVSTSAALQGYKLEVERITRLANSLQKFTSLTKNDQSSLLKENADLIVSLRGALFFDKRKKGRDQVMSSMGHSTYIVFLIVLSFVLTRAKYSFQRTER